LAKLGTPELAHYSYGLAAVHRRQFILVASQTWDTNLWPGAEPSAPRDAPDRNHPSQVNGPKYELLA